MINTVRKKTRLKTAKGRKTSSTKWLQRHRNDPYVVMAKDANYRSRAAFKLLEINEKFGILHGNDKNFTVIDLGCAPGSWLQVTENVLSKKSSDYKIIGVDLQEVSYENNKVVIIKGDFEDPAVLQKINDEILGRKINVIMSDMAANSCGDSQTDHIRVIRLAKMVIDFIKLNLSPGGNAVIKIIQGGMSNNFMKEVKPLFKYVKWYKPKSSYTDSAEIYLIMQSFICQQQ